MRKVTALVVLTATGCQSWRVQSEPAPTVVSGRHSKIVRLTLKSGQSVEMTDVQVQGDSIVGLVKESRVAVATADVERISTRHFSAVKSVFAVVTIFVAVAVIAGAAALASTPSGTGGSCSSAAVAAPAG